MGELDEFDDGTPFVSGPFSNVQRWRGRLRGGGAKLDEAAVRAIRAKAKAGVPTAQIAKEHSVKMGTVNHIVARRTWRHIPEEAK